jgi:hypothetical protein
MARTTAERLAKWQEIRDSLEDRLAEMSSKPRPTYNVDGQQMDFTEYQKYLMSALKAAEEQVLALENRDDDSPGMTETQLVTGG